MSERGQYHRWNDHDNEIIREYFGAEPVKATADRIGVSSRVLLAYASDKLGLTYRRTRLKRIADEGATCESCDHISPRKKFCYAYCHPVDKDSPICEDYAKAIKRVRNGTDK